MRMRAGAYAGVCGCMGLCVCANVCKCVRMCADVCGCVRMCADVCDCVHACVCVRTPHWCSVLTGRYAAAHMQTCGRRVTLCLLRRRFRREVIHGQGDYVGEVRNGAPHGLGIIR
eukprot:GHVU01070878.1.p1 GENE.GHVU01070878.1~~GHVU01070878.1.p1  ORF type:complete len:115 (+),score=2.34 GHVU01070878.1:3-347(+)